MTGLFGVMDESKESGHAVVSQYLRNVLRCVTIACLNADFERRYLCHVESDSG
jgi:hypothetical protein